MKDEIKEILDNIRKIIKSNREDDFNRIIYDCDSVEKLLDYITNLQEEYEKADYDRHKLFDRIEKASELIRFIAFNSERPLTVTELNKVYNILQGVDKK